jgi:hypothetical protein
VDGSPTARRPARFPAEYGVKVTDKSILPWSFVEERLRAAAN